MMTVTRQHGGWLACAWFPVVLGLLLSCSSAPEHPLLDTAVGEDWNASVDKHIAEPQRAARLKQLGAELVTVANSIQQDVEALERKLMDLNENYGANQEQFEQLLEDFSRQRRPKFARYRDILFAMREEASADQWKALTK